MHCERRYGSRCASFHPMSVGSSGKLTVDILTQLILRDFKRLRAELYDDQMFCGDPHIESLLQLLFCLSDL